MPKEALQDNEDGWDLPVELVGDRELFLLRVRGDSMIDAAIADDDWVAVRKQQDAENGENGEIVVAMIDGDTTVKTAITGFRGERKGTDSLTGRHLRVRAGDPAQG